MSCWVCERANGTCEHTGGSHLDERTAQLVAAITRAETAERDLAALRRRVEEAASGDDKRTARVRATEVIMVGDVGHLLSVIDAQRVAAGDLRGMLREACGSIAWWVEHAGEAFPVHAYKDRALLKRPNVIAATKGSTP